MDDETDGIELRGGDKWVAKHDATTAAARKIMAREKAAEEAKTARLSQARMAREASDNVISASE